MVTLDQVENYVREPIFLMTRPRQLLKETNGDILEAIINLEKENRIKSPEGGLLQFKKYRTK